MIAGMKLPKEGGECLRTIQHKSVHRINRIQSINSDLFVRLECFNASGFHMYSNKVIYRTYPGEC